MPTYCWPLTAVVRCTTVMTMTASFVFEIPDQAENPRLYHIVSSCMMHSPCGALDRDAPCIWDLLQGAP
jgi:hypothetical protein